MSDVAFWTRLSWEDARDLFAGIDPRFQPQGYRAVQAQRLSGATTRQLRYWDEIGLVRPSVQSTGGKPGRPRLYSDGDVIRLRWIVNEMQNGRSLVSVRKEVERARGAA